MAAALHRTRERRNLTIPVRVQLIEEDVDEIEGVQHGVTKRLDTLNARLFGILLAMLAGLIALAANLIVLLVK